MSTERMALINVMHAQSADPKGWSWLAIADAILAAGFSQRQGEATTLDALARAYRDYAIEGCTTLPTWGELPEADRKHYRSLVRRRMLAATFDAPAAAAVENEASQYDRQEATWRDECLRLRAEILDIAYMAVPGSGWSRDAVEKAARAAIASPATGPADVVELHAETLIAVAAMCASMGSDDAADAAAEIRAFVAAANGEPEVTGPDDPADLNPEPMNTPHYDSVRNENGSHR